MAYRVHVVRHGRRSAERGVQVAAFTAFAYWMYTHYGWLAKEAEVLFRCDEYPALKFQL
jgi:predicted acetyltransferase